MLNCEHLGNSPAKHLTCLLCMVPWWQVPKETLFIRNSPATHPGKSQLEQTGGLTVINSSVSRKYYDLSWIHVYLFVCTFPSNIKSYGIFIVSCFISTPPPASPPSLHWAAGEFVQMFSAGSEGGWNTICTHTGGKITGDWKETWKIIKVRVYFGWIKSVLNNIGQDFWTYNGDLNM